MNGVGDFARRGRVDGGAVDEKSFRANGGQGRFKDVVEHIFDMGRTRKDSDYGFLVCGVSNIFL